MIPVKVVVVEDQQLFAEALKIIVSASGQFEVIEVLNDGNLLLPYLSLNTSSLILLDLNLHGKDSLQLCTAVKEAYPTLKVVLLTAYDGDDIIKKAKKAKADGYIIKDITSGKLIDALSQIMANPPGDYVVINKRPVSKQSIEFNDDFLLQFRLTTRELEILKLIVSGISANEISRKLFISYDTCKTHRSHIFAKLGVMNVQELMKFAMKNNLL